MGRLAHAFLAAGNHHLGIAAADSLNRHVHRFQSRATNLVDGHGRYRGRNAGVDGGLASGVLANTGGKNLTQHYLVDLVTGDTGFFQ